MSFDVILHFISRLFMLTSDPLGFGRAIIFAAISRGMYGNLLFILVALNRMGFLLILLRKMEISILFILLSFMNIVLILK